MNETVTRIRYKLGNWVVSLIIVIMGLLFLIASLLVAQGFWSSAFGELSSILFISGAWNIIYDLYLRADFVKMIDENNEKVLHQVKEDTEKIIQKVRISSEIEKLGLLDIQADSMSYDFSETFLESKELFIVLNHGRSWISRNTYLFHKRFQDLDKKTVVFMLHPESCVLEALARKENSSVEAIKDKIAESVQILKSVKLENTQLEILGHPFFNPHRVILTENYAITTGYPLTPGRVLVPLYKYGPILGKRDCYYKIIQEDILALISYSQDIYNYDLLRAKEKERSYRL